MTGHDEVVRVVFDPTKVSYEQLLKTFWESHDPTQGMRQGNDVGTQYRSGIYVYADEQRRAAEASKAAYEKALAARGLRRDHHRDPATRPSSTSPRTTISSISPRTRTAIAAWAEPASPARSAPASRPTLNPLRTKSRRLARKVLDVGLAGATEIEHAAAAEGHEIGGAAGERRLVAKAAIGVTGHELLGFPDGGLQACRIESLRDGNAYSVRR